VAVELTQAFVQSFIEGDFGFEIAYENTDFTPTAGTPYAELRMFGNDITPFSLSDSDQTDGVFKVTLNFVRGDGDINPKILAQQVIDCFYIGREISYEGVTATVTKKRITDTSTGDGWYKLTVTIFYKAFLIR